MRPNGYDPYAGEAGEEQQPVQQRTRVTRDRPKFHWSGVRPAAPRALHCPASAYGPRAKPKWRPANSIRPARRRRPILRVPAGAGTWSRMPAVAQRIDGVQPGHGVVVLGPCAPPPPCLDERNRRCPHAKRCREQHQRGDQQVKREGHQRAIVAHQRTEETRQSFGQPEHENRPHQRVDGNCDFRRDVDQDRPGRSLRRIAR